MGDREGRGGSGRGPRVQVPDAPSAGNVDCAGECVLGGGIAGNLDGYKDCPAGDEVSIRRDASISESCEADVGLTFEVGWVEDCCVEMRLLCGSDAKFDVASSSEKAGMVNGNIPSYIWGRF